MKTVSRINVGRTFTPQDVSNLRPKNAPLRNDRTRYKIFIQKFQPKFSKDYEKYESEFSLKITRSARSFIKLKTAAVVN